MSQFRDYENGVADVLAFIAHGSAVVDRNVRLPGKRSHRSRQIDVIVRGRVFGMADATMIVDCKRRKTRVDVKAIESFIGMVEDVGAEVGMIVTSSGMTPAAQRRAQAERGVRLEVLPLEELVQWSPPGTITITYGVPTPRFSDAARSLREAGFRVRPELAYEARSGESLLGAFRHTGQRNPAGEIQQKLLELAEGVLQGEDIHVRHVAHGLTIAGGTPGHRWLEVLAAGAHTGIKVLASSERELDEELNKLAQSLAHAGVNRASLSVERPPGWPEIPIFMGWAQSQKTGEHGA